MNPGVYAILNVVNGQRYVGSSAYIDERMENHFHMLELGKHHNYLLQRAYDSCGDVWAFIILEQCSRPLLAVTEQKWINRFNKLNRLFNIDMTVDRSHIKNDNQ